MTSLLDEYIHPESGRRYHLTKKPPQKKFFDDIKREESLRKAYEDDETLKLVLKTYRSITNTV